MRRRSITACILLGAAALVALSIAPASGQGARVLRLGATGDILLHTRVVAAGRAHGFDRMFSGLREVVAPEELAFANLETPLSEERDPSRGDPPILGAPPEVAGALRRAGLDVLSLANNHAFDQRDVGLATTLDAVRRAGLTPIGADEDVETAHGPVFVEHGGLRVAFVAYTYSLNGYPPRRRAVARVGEWDRNRARRALSIARENADIVVASVHWGLAYRNENRLEQRRDAAFLVRHGADVVLGHGPHVLQPVERLASPRGEAVVAYSLGNLVSNQGYRFHPTRRERGVARPLWLPTTRDGLWLRLAMEVSSNGEIRARSISGTPLFTENNFWDEERRRADAPDIRVVPISSMSDRELARARWNAIAEALGPTLGLTPFTGV